MAGSVIEKIRNLIAKDKWFYSDGLLVGLVRILNVGLSFAVSVILARVLGSRQFGIYTQVLAIINIIGAPVELGLPQLLVREIAKYVEVMRFSLVNGIMRWAVTIVLVSSLIVIVIYPFVRPLAGSQITQDIHEPLLWALYLVPILGFSSLVASATRALGKVWLAQVPEMVIMPLILVLTVIIINALVNIRYSPNIIFMIQIVGGMIAVTVGAVFLSNLYSKNVPKHIKPEYNSGVWLRSTLSLASVTGIQLINKWASILILGIFVKYAELGVYRVAVQIALLADFGRMVITPIMSPQISKTYAAGDRKKLQYLARLSARWIFFVNALIYIAFIVGGQFLIQTFFGEEYLPAFSVVLVLLAGQVVDSITGASVLFLVMTGFENDTALIRFITTAFNLTLIYVFSSLWGIIGAAISTSITLIIWNWIIYWMVRNKLGVDCLPIAIGKQDVD